MHVLLYVPLSDTAFYYLLLKLSLKAGNVYLLSVLPALERGREAAFPPLVVQEDLRNLCAPVRGRRGIG